MSGMRSCNLENKEQLKCITIKNIPMTELNFDIFKHKFLKLEETIDQDL